MSKSTFILAHSVLGNQIYLLLVYSLSAQTCLNSCLEHTIEQHRAQSNPRKKRASNKKQSVQFPRANTLCHREKLGRICNRHLQNNFQGCQGGLEIHINLHTFEFETLFIFHGDIHSTEFFNQSGKLKGIVLCVEKAPL
ncbi:hypothetical protein CEXT_419031 [Caerostris extrusa]|uniref:Secreted protein n=1 Tax=Caerostris extrusa TaxID=172846 RepID=A0AAV4RX41_CAEEX|nr:hypothetical protein CEXT_419031 [Caerostris extrusa]